MDENSGWDLRPVPIRATSALIADQLRDRIIDGSFPAGSQMIEAQLSLQLGVSRGPVREALQRLIQEGLLTSVRNRGVFVVDLGPDDVVDIYEARRAIERFVAVELHRSKSPHFLDELSDIIKTMEVEASRGDLQRLAAGDVAFHETLVRSSGNRRLSRMFSTLIAETQICISTVGGLYTELSDLVAEHRQLLDLLRNGTRPKVVAAIDEHLESAVTALTTADTELTSGR